MTIRTSEDNTIISGCNVVLDIDANNIGLAVHSDLAASDFKKGDTRSSNRDIESYTVLAGTGIPLFIHKSDDNGNFSLKFKGTDTTDAKVYPGDELLYLKCERMFVQGQNFKFWNFSGNSWNSNKLHANEADILEVYFELDKDKNILDMYVLASGGVNDSGSTAKPEAWPSDFWKSDFANYIVYVSRASWKINNLPSGFTWD